MGSKIRAKAVAPADESVYASSRARLTELVLSSSEYRLCTRFIHIMARFKSPRSDVLFFSPTLSSKSRLQGFSHCDMDIRPCIFWALGLFRCPPLCVLSPYGSLDRSLDQIPIQPPKLEFPSSKFHIPHQGVSVFR